MQILQEERGLLYRRDEYKRLLMPGKYFIPPGCRVERYCIDEPFNPDNHNINGLLEQDKAIAENLDVIEVPDGRLLLVHENGNLIGAFLGDNRKVCYWKFSRSVGSERTRKFTLVDLNDAESAKNLDRAVLTHPLVTRLNIVLRCDVKSWEKGLLFIDDQFIHLLESGVHFFWDVDINSEGQGRIEIVKTDLRQQQIDISGQEIMTADKTPLRVNFFCRYRVIDIMKSILSIKDLREQFYTALQIVLREYLGSLTFDALMEKRRSIATEMSETLREVCAGFGLEFIGAGIKDIILPGEIREIMNQVLIAEKKAQANVVMRREETASTRSLLNTAKLMEENTVLARLKEMEYIERIALNIKEISLSGKFQVFDELRTLFTPKSGG